VIELRDFLEIDLPALATGTLAALSCGLLGNFLLLQRKSLLGDAVSHAVLPGIVLAFLLTGSTGTWPMMLGAAGAALASVLLVDVVQRAARIEAGAAMAVVLTAMFALGVVLLEQSGARVVHLDVQHALMGSLEGIVWLGARDGSALFDPARLASLPAPLLRLAGLTPAVLLFVLLLRKELAIASFDPSHADSLGIPARLVGLLLLLASAAAAVAAFDAVGAILTIAMFVCPAATARMLTDRLGRQIALSALVAVLSGVLGYALAAWVTPAIGLERGLGAAGTIAVVAGCSQALSILFAPRYGALARARARAGSRRGEAGVGGTAGAER
jgi:manganese/zinc/iron transport system permease protein